MYKGISLNKTYFKGEILFFKSAQENNYPEIFIINPKHFWGKKEVAYTNKQTDKQTHFSRIFIQNKHPHPAVCFWLLKGQDNHSMTIKNNQNAPHFEARGRNSTGIRASCASQMLDEIIVISQLHVYHPSVVSCWTETDIKGGCAYSSLSVQSYN